MKRLSPALLFTAALLLAGPAAAQFASGGGPIDITANEVEIIDAQHQAIWRGAVEVLQNRNRMRADELRIFFAETPSRGGASGGAAPGRNWGRVQKVQAEGNVFFVSPAQTARGDHGLYEAGADTITITGDVIVSQGKSVVHGTRLVIDLKTNRATMAASGQGGSGRVRGVFYPNGASAPGAPTPPPPRQP